VAKRCEVQVAYAIGVARPVGVNVNTFGTGKVSDEALEKYILANFDMRPKALIEELGLLAPVFKPTAAYGHFGRREFRWEATDRAEAIADDLLPKETKRGTAVRTNGAPANGHNKAQAGRPAKRGAMAEALRRLATASAPSR
jgi:S-adenosylmethionine synthetase